MPHRLLIVVNDPGFFLSHRAPIATEASRQGFEVHVATPVGPAVQDISALGFFHHPLPMTRSGVNPLSEVRLFLHLYRLFRTVRPSLVHLVTIKPVLYGSLAARLAGVPAMVAAISGLGHVFTLGSLKRRVLRMLVTLLYRAGLRHRTARVIFQNPVDRSVLVEAGCVRAAQAVMIRGSGVDLALCRMVAAPIGPPVFVFAARLLRSKGIGEFVAAADVLAARGIPARCLAAGEPDPQNPDSVTLAEIENWRARGCVKFVGFRPVAELFAAANVVVLPSYYGEGLPKVLMEAAACGRPVITTDMPGCRDAVEAGVTGILVSPRDIVALADAMADLAADEDRRARMGQAGRALAEREFGVEKIVAAHLAIYHELLLES